MARPSEPKAFAAVRPGMCALSSLLFATLLASPAPAQDPAPKKEELVEEILEIWAAPQEPTSWFAKTQEEDGHWSAARFGGRAARDLRVTALVTLAYMADGNTLRAGPERQIAKNAYRWLLRSQDEQGRFGLHSEPDWILDHAIASYAMCEALRRSEYRIHNDEIAGAIGALLKHVQRVGIDALDVETVLWCHMLVRSARKWEAFLRGREALKVETLGWQELLAAVPLEKTPVPKNARERAASVLLREISGAPVSDDEVAKAWEEAEGMGRLYAYLACYRRGGKPYATMSKGVKARIVDAQLMDGESRGSWNPDGELGRDVGRVGTTAVKVLMLTVYYRYCALELTE